MSKNDDYDERIMTGGLKVPAEVNFRLNLCKWLLLISLFSIPFLGWPVLLVSAASLIGLTWTLWSFLKPDLKKEE